jgi:hypothetical protein
LVPFVFHCHINRLVENEACQGQFVGTMKRRPGSRDKLLTEPELLSDWAVQGGLSDAGVDVTDPEVAGGMDFCVRLEKGLFAVVIAGDVVLLLADSPLAPPHTAAKTTAAVLQHTVIAILPL